MKLKHIELDNVRNIKHLRLDFDAPFTVAFSRNGTCKTTIQDGQRSATSRGVATQAGDVLSFDLIYGSDTNGGENPEAGEEVVLEYSNDGGANWFTIRVYPLPNTTWSRKNEPLPAGAIQAPLTAPEGDNGATTFVFQVVRSGQTTTATTAPWSVLGSGSNPANGLDFVGGALPTGIVSFAAGELVKSVSVQVQGDMTLEPNETFDFVFAASGGAPVATATIVNDDTQQPGDFNGDGEFDCVDVDALVANIVSQSGNSLYDLTNDGQLSPADLDRWLMLAGAANLPSGNPYRLGDANLDGTVDGSDFVVWNSRKFTSGNGWCGGDFNADGVTDGSDFLLWNSNKFTSSIANLRIDTPPTASLAARDLLFAWPVQNDGRQPSDIGLSVFPGNRPTVARAFSRGLIAPGGIPQKPDVPRDLAWVILANYRSPEMIMRSTKWHAAAPAVRRAH